MKTKVVLMMTGAMFASSAMAQELTIWDWKYSDPVTQAYYDSARDAFAAEHPDVTLNFVAQPHDQYYTILGTALASGEGPDVILLHGGSQTTSRAGSLVALDDLAEGFAGVDAFSTDGHVYALPLTIQGLVVYYNKQAYADAGLDPEAAPQTWDDLVAACDAIIEAGNVPCFALGNKEGFAGEFMATLGTVNQFTDEDYAAWAAGDLSWEDPHVRPIVDLWVEMSERGWYQPGPNSTAKFMDEYEIFMRGEAAHTVGLLSDVAHWMQFDEFLGPENVGAFAFPTPGSDVALLPFAGGIGWAVTASSDQQELALDLVRTLADGDREAIWALDTGALPGNTAVDTSALSSPSLSTILNLMATVPGGQPHALLNPVVQEEWHRQSQLLLNGDVTADQAIATMEATRLDNQ